MNNEDAVFTIDFSEEDYYRIKLVMSIINSNREAIGNPPLDESEFVIRCLDRYFRHLGILGADEEKIRAYIEEEEDVGDDEF